MIKLVKAYALWPWKIRPTIKFKTKSQRRFRLRIAKIQCGVPVPPTPLVSDKTNAGRP